MKHKDLPDRWADRLAQWLRANTAGKYDTLGASDFPANGGVEIEFGDGSVARFRHSFMIKAPEYGEIGVFSEHCGYHIFPSGDVVVNALND